MLLKQGSSQADTGARGESARREDPRVVRTRQLILQAFTELLQEKSFQAITIHDIAARATINRVTFYAHFADKYALLEYAIREMIRQRLYSRMPEGAPYSQENLAQLILTVCEFLGEIGRVCPPPHGQMEPLMEKQIKAELNEILAGWLSEEPAGVSPQTPTPEQAAMVASWAIYGAAVQWTHQEQKIPAGEYVGQILPLILGSMASAG
jgi:AcrR family transcriptional regulator